MVKLVVATTTDPASICPAKELLAMPGWQPGPTLDRGIRSFSNGDVRLLEHDKGIVEEDDLDQRWENATGQPVDEVIFLSKHTAVSNRPALTIHPIGVPHLKEGDVPPQGGRPGWAAPPNPRMGPWMILLTKIAESHNLVPEFEITFEATHHGPVTTKPTMFIEIGSTEEYWKRPDAAQVVALLVWEGLGLGGGSPVGNWSSTSANNKVLLGIGGGHYVPRHTDVIKKDRCWVGQLLSGYSLPMEDPGPSRGKVSAQDIAGTWKHSIRAAYDATKAGFPGGEILAHLDQKIITTTSIQRPGYFSTFSMPLLRIDLLSPTLQTTPLMTQLQGTCFYHLAKQSFKSWQKNAIIEFLGANNIKIGKPGDFC